MYTSVCLPFYILCTLSSLISQVKLTQDEIKTFLKDSEDQLKYIYMYLLCIMQCGTSVFIYCNDDVIITVMVQ